MSNDYIIDIKSVGEIIIDIKCLCGKLLNQYSGLCPSRHFINSYNRIEYCNECKNIISMDYNHKKICINCKTYIDN